MRAGSTEWLSLCGWSASKNWQRHFGKQVESIFHGPNFSIHHESNKATPKFIPRKLLQFYMGNKTAHSNIIDKANPERTQIFVKWK